MPAHHVLVTPDHEALDRLARQRPVTDTDRAAAFSWRVVCEDPAACPGWVECHEEHGVSEVSASEGPWESDCRCDDGDACDVPWCQEEVFPFHGVLHQWRQGSGWVTPYDGCPVEGFATAPGDVPTDRPGRYLVDIEWDENGDTCEITLAEPATGTDAG